MRLIQDERGPVMLEFVISCIMFVIIFAGVCNLGLVFKDRMAVAAAVREAGRTAAVTGNTWDGSQVGYGVLQRAGIGSERANVTVTAGVNTYTASVTCTSPIALPFAAGLLGGSVWENHVTLSDTKYFRKEPSW